MLGALFGDISGSRYEWSNIRTKEFPILDENCHPTDDSVLTLAVAQAILNHPEGGEALSRATVQEMQRWGNLYPDAGYGGFFRQWLTTPNPQPYHSFGNGAAMRVSPCGFAARTLAEAKALSHSVTCVTHNHPEGLKGAEATAVCIFMARQHCTKAEIRKEIQDHYYDLSFTLDEIRPTYTFQVSCQGSVPQAIEAFLEGEDFEDTIRNAISIGGDSDTIAAIAGGIAEAFFGIPQGLRTRVLEFLDDRQKDILLHFSETFLQ